VTSDTQAAGFEKEGDGDCRCYSRLAEQGSNDVFAAACASRSDGSKLSMLIWTSWRSVCFLAVVAILGWSLSEASAATLTYTSNSTEAHVQITEGPNVYQESDAYAPPGPLAPYSGSVEALWPGFQTDGAVSVISASPSGASGTGSGVAITAPSDNSEAAAVQGQGVFYFGATLDESALVRFHITWDSTSIIDPVASSPAMFYFELCPNGNCTPNLLAEIQNDSTLPAGDETLILALEAGSYAFYALADAEAGANLVPQTFTDQSVQASFTAEVTVLCPTVPNPACAASARSGVRLTDASTPKASWKWQRGLAAVSQSDFGDPVSGGTDYRLCVYDNVAGAPQLKMVSVIPAGGDCSGRACWTPLGTTGWTYKDSLGSADGITKMTLKGGPAGRPAITVTGAGLNLPLPNPVDANTFFDQSPAVIVQLFRADTGACWSSTFNTNTVNTGTAFAAKAP
jgi:hypothetical protein